MILKKIKFLSFDEVGMSFEHANNEAYDSDGVLKTSRR